MTKIEFTKELAGVLQVSLKESKRILEAILDGMVGALRRGGRVEIRGFGSWMTRSRAARRARNPKTGAVVVTNPKRVARFKPSRELLAIVNRPRDP